MSNKDIVGKWFEAIWGERYNPAVIDQLADPHIVMQYPLHPANSGKTIRFTGMTIFRIVGGKILEEIGEEDALKAGLQLDVVRTS